MEWGGVGQWGREVFFSHKSKWFTTWMIMTSLSVAWLPSLKIRGSGGRAEGIFDPVWVTQPEHLCSRRSGPLQPRWSRFSKFTTNYPALTEDVFFLFCSYLGVKRKKKIFSPFPGKGWLRRTDTWLTDFAHLGKIQTCPSKDLAAMERFKRDFVQLLHSS